jgi:hypothetical protein
MATSEVPLAGSFHTIPRLELIRASTSVAFAEVV